MNLRRWDATSFKWGWFTISNTRPGQQKTMEAMAHIYSWPISSMVDLSIVFLYVYQAGYSTVLTMINHH